MEETARERTRLEFPVTPARDRCLLVNTASQPPWKDAEPLQGSALLGRLQGFLPAMQKANEELERAAAEEPDICNIESFTEGDPHIEMNLACGVLDLKDSSAAAAAQKAVNVPNTTQAMSQLPVLKEDKDGIEDVRTKPGIFDFSRSAARAESNMMIERASRRTGVAKEAHTDKCAEPGVMHSLGRRTGDQDPATSDSCPTFSKLSSPSSI